MAAIRAGRAHAFDKDEDDVQPDGEGDQDTDDDRWSTGDEEELRPEGAGVEVGTEGSDKEEVQLDWIWRR